MMQHRDVLIVGAGPAGCAAAIQCAANGLKVTMVDGCTWPRDRPGETLHPGAEPLLDALGVGDVVRRAGFLRHQGIWVERDGHAQFEPYGEGREGPWRGLQAWRSEFDNILLQRAEALGVEVRQNCRAKDALCRSGRVTGAQTTGGVFAARFTLDASGSSGWLSRQLRLDRLQIGRQRLIQYGYMTGSCPARDDAPRFKQMSGTWLWTARVRPRVYQWTRLLRLNQEINPLWVPEEFQALSPRCPPRVCDMTWRLLEQCAGAGYFVLGDAAVMLDPSSSHGVLRALMSGMLAAFYLAMVVHGSLPEEDAAGRYRQYLRQWFRHDTARLNQFAASAKIPK